METLYYIHYFSRTMKIEMLAQNRGGLNIEVCWGIIGPYHVILCMVVLLCSVVSLSATRGAVVIPYKRHTDLAISHVVVAAI